MEKWKHEFHRIFGNREDIKIYFSPGRINLIGEHIDYNGGFVFPAAISLGTYGVVIKNEDQKIRLYSENFKEQGIIECNLNQLEYVRDHGWANYAKGIIDYFIQKNYDISFGFDLFVSGDLPTASGLSSSASLEVLVSYIANDLYQLGLNRAELALISQSVENTYMKMHCGIMDQLVIACGVKDKALFMNTATLEIQEKNATFDGYQWVIMNTKYQRKTTGSKYNERRSECEQALNIIQTAYDINYLCDLKVKDLRKIKELVSDEILYKRAKHVITEQDRTIRSKVAMEKGDAVLFANLLNQSHESLKIDYEVTGIHLDTLCEAARTHGAIGARVTGAGFGGCAIALVENSKLESMKQEVHQIYLDKTGLDAEFYNVTFEDGVHEVK